MSRWIGFLAAAWCLSACSLNNRPAGSHAAPLESGIDTQYVADSVRPQDDFYRHLNGKWLDTFVIPPDKGAYGSFTFVDDQAQQQLRAIVDGLSDDSAADGGADARKLADLYASFMDEPRLETLGATPLRAQFAAIDAMSSKRDIPALIARFNRSGAGAPYDVDIDVDARDSSHYTVILHQSGLGLPDRDYYLKSEEKFKDARAHYLAHVEKMLSMVGEQQAARSAADILKLETAMATLQWTRVDNRDPVKTYNKFAVADLHTLMPAYDWTRYFDAGELAGKMDHVVVRQPDYFSGLDRLIADTPLPTWKNYFKWHQLSAAAPFLSKVFVDERFAFVGTALRGVPENRPRWKRGMSLLDDSMGEAIGRIYVAKYFPPQNKARMADLVHHLIEAYRLDIDTLDWMGAKTKKGAQEKLAKLVTKIGYPDTWRDYASLVVAREDLWGNVQRATEFEYARGVAKLGRPVDRTEWFMTPQTVNAYYNPVMNEIVFPAAILQPPFFDVQADDAVNYGAIVAVIGHEVSHGFDDKGSQYDADGNLHDWFTPEDHARFEAKTRALVAQYEIYEPVPGYHVNGKLTLGENIGDNSGLAVAFKAYQESLAGKSAPVIDGFTGAQRFYLGYAQVWRGKVREDQAVQAVTVDPHSPPEVRGTAPLRNQPGFYAAFSVKPGDKMYLPPGERVEIW